MKILHAVGARPNFMKLAGVWRALKEFTHFEQIILHTGQHYDENMSEVFFQQLHLPRPNYNLGVGSGSHAYQTGQIILKMEEILLALKPDLVLVYGDVNSTLAGALVCAKIGIPVGHIEAGLRSYDRSMPEEINRILTDRISDLLFTPSRDANENLKREGIDAAKIHFVGNVMIDTLINMRELALRSSAKQKYMPADSVRYILTTLHRPDNVDDESVFSQIIESLIVLSHQAQVIFPVHPRTRQALNRLNPSKINSQLKLIEPLDYVDFLALMMNASLVITDSGGIQEETTFLGVPCLTMRKNTERPITVEIGSNIIVGQDVDKLKRETTAILHGRKKEGKTPELWDGRASERIAEIIRARL